ncbi:hypothetical protein VNO77_17226 [Canavalia gladiata]|uniref:Uncharacterized protein n=1 Tax=Canavalia gladiata TaxID=3824 RepID=A0AAN9QGF0_CANGL
MLLGAVQSVPREALYAWKEREFMGVSREWGACPNEGMNAWRVKYATYPTRENRSMLSELVNPKSQSKTLGPTQAVKTGLQIHFTKNFLPFL